MTTPTYPEQEQQMLEYVSFNGLLPRGWRVVLEADYAGRRWTVFDVECDVSDDPDSARWWVIGPYSNLYGQSYYCCPYHALKAHLEMMRRLLERPATDSDLGEAT